MTTLAIEKQANFYPINEASLSAYVRSWNENLPKPYVAVSNSISISSGNLITFLQSEGIRVDDPIAVEEFLTNNSGIVAHLFDAPKVISVYFPGSKMKLGLFRDPDAIEDNPEIFMEIETDFSPDDANRALSELNHNWLLSSKDVDLLGMNLTLKFI